jgi:hypothetical protein
MANFIQGLIQQVIQDQRASTDESRTQAISLANLAAADQKLQNDQARFAMEQTKFDRETDAYNKKQNFAKEQADIYKRNFTVTRDIQEQGPDGSVVKRQVIEEATPENAPDYLQRTLKFNMEQLGAGIKAGVLSPEQIQQAQEYGRQLEKIGVDKLIEQMIAKPNDPNVIAKAAPLFGLDPSTTSITVGKDRDGLPSVIANYRTPDGKPATRSLRPEILALGSQAWGRVEASAASDSTISSNLSATAKNRAQASLAKTQESQALNPDGKPMTKNEQIQRLADINKNIQTMFASELNTVFGKDGVTFIGNPVERDATVAELRGRRDAANTIADATIKITGDRNVNAGIAYKYGTIVAAANRNKENLLVKLYQAGLLAEGREVGGKVYVRTQDGVWIPNISAEVVKEYQAYRAATNPPLPPGAIPRDQRR